MDDLVVYLQGIKPGDEIFVQPMGFYARVQRRIAARVTATQIIIHHGAGEVRYRRKDGREVGSPCSSRIITPTDAIKARYEFEALKDKLIRWYDDWLRHTTVDDLEELRRCAAALGIETGEGE